jgi:hypothetical protein
MLCLKQAGSELNIKDSYMQDIHKINLEKYRVFCNRSPGGRKPARIFTDKVFHLCYRHVSLLLAMPGLEVILNRKDIIICENPCNQRHIPFLVLRLGR